VGGNREAREYEEFGNIGNKLFQLVCENVNNMRNKLQEQGRKGAFDLLLLDLGILAATLAVV